MWKEYRTLSFLFFIGLILQLVIGFINPDLFAFVQLIVISVLILFFSFKTRLRGRFHRRMLYALLVTLVSMLFGIPGRMGYEVHWDYLIGSQILSYLLFIRTFYLDFSSAPELDKKGAKIAIVLTGMVSIGSYFYVRPYLGKLQVLVLCLTLLISLMIMMAAFRNKRVDALSFVVVLMAAVLFGVFNFIYAILLFMYTSKTLIFIDAAVLSIAIYLMVLGGVSRKLITFHIDD
jgi:hypothetical protein